MATAETVNESQKSASRAKSDENMWAMLCHLGGLFGAVIPPGNIVAPLVIWLIHRDQYPLVEDQGREAVNFQISLSIYVIASAILIFFAIGIFLLIGLAIFALVLLLKPTGLFGRKL